MSILTDGYFDGARDAILNLQNPDGSIPWFKNGVIDPWNHLEAAMGLNLIGERVAAEQAISFLRDSQASDGSWLGQLGSAVPIDETLHQFTMRGLEEGHLIRDTNFIAYIATAIWHHYCLHGDSDYAAANWPMVKAAVNFVVALQSPEGDIRWTAPDPQTPEDDALVTGNVMRPPRFLKENLALMRSVERAKCWRQWAAATLVTMKLLAIMRVAADALFDRRLRKAWARWFKLCEASENANVCDTLDSYRNPSLPQVRTARMEKYGPIRAAHVRSGFPHLGRPLIGTHPIDELVLICGEHGCGGAIMAHLRGRQRILFASVVPGSERTYRFYDKYFVRLPFERSDGESPYAAWLDAP